MVRWTEDELKQFRVKPALKTVKVKPVLGETLICRDCHKPTPRTGYSQVRCPACRVTYQERKGIYPDVDPYVGDAQVCPDCEAKWDDTETGHEPPLNARQYSRRENGVTYDYFKCWCKPSREWRRYK